MTAHALDERDHATALKAAISTSLGTEHVYEYGGVPGLDGNTGTEPAIYVLVQVERTFTPSTHGSRRAIRTAWRASIRSVGTTADECRWASHRVTLALDSQRLTIDARTTTPIAHETSSTPTFDRGRYESLTRYTYAL